MSKMGKVGHFFLGVAKVTPGILLLTPLAPLAGVAAAAIQEAEAIPGATGSEKLAHVTAILVDAAHGANLQAGHTVVDPVAVQAEAATVISAVVQAAKLAHPTPTV